MSRNGQQETRTKNLPKAIHAQGLQLWKERVLQKAKRVDPDDEHDWDTLAYGFFLGLGMMPEAALEAALSVEK